jgi:two-component system cell cycle sensor histidine kinase/response regulator CckA
MTCVYLDQRPPDTPEPWQPQPEPRPELKGTGLASILLAEDDETVREVMARMLMDGGYDVVTAGDGREALDILATQPDMDLVITDLRMPRMGGRAMADQLLARRPDLPIIYISGYVADWDPGFTASPTRAFLRKPFSEEDLLRTVQTLLSGRGR